jgi:2-polyprenyl-6-methoxyphenol hydroxylase-like FAD-dependent oxidoreductase
MAGHERFDAVIVGARCAGAAAAIALGRAGRRVVAIDRARFPSDTLSTHVLFPSGVAELEHLGVLDDVLALGAPHCHFAGVSAGGHHVRERFTPVDGIDFAICQPRPELDRALVEAARRCGAEVRESTSVEGLLWEDGRVVGVRCRERGGEECEIRASLVIGADGRRSTVAEHVGAARPYRGSRNGRGLAFWYMDDPKTGTHWRDVIMQWRVGRTMGMVFPCPDERMVVLFMPPADDVVRFRADPEAAWLRMLNENRRLAERVGGAANATKMRSTADTVAYFRRSSGPGWALTGDAGHFKDPVIAQGIRDSLRFGRLAGEAAAPSLDDPGRLDAALEQWERDRDLDCGPAYHFANHEGWAVEPSPIALEALATFSRDDLPQMSDTFNRVRRVDEVITPVRALTWAARALARPGVDRRAILREAARESQFAAAAATERLRPEFRRNRPSSAETTGWEWPPRPVARTGATDPTPSEVIA